MAIHYFDTDIAKEIGILPAILLQNINYWCEKNKANDKHLHDGFFWTYNSQKAFSELFDYASKRQIETALIKLKDDGYIITGNYNQVAYDRTLWYAITEKGKCISPKCEMDITKWGNAYHQNATPIPNNKPNNKLTDNKPNNKLYNDSYDVSYSVSENDTKKINYSGIADYYNTICISLPKVTKMTDKRKKSIKAMLNVFSESEIGEIFKMAEESDFLTNRNGENKNGFSATFDWLTNTNNATKVIEGNYKNKPRQSKTSDQAFIDKWKDA